MNGFPSANRGAGTSLEAPNERSALRSILRNTSRDFKVIFGAHRGVFDLKRIDIENFFHLVDQRVDEQNGCKSVYSEVAVYYTNGTSRRFPSVEDFSSYTETSKRYPTLVTLHASFFISFPDSDEPEKQEIDIVIRSSGSTNETLDMVKNDSRMRVSGDKVQMEVGSDGSRFGLISYTINHTRVTWGLDLEHHIRGHIEKLLLEPTPGDTFLRKISGPLNMFTTLFVGLYAVNLLIDLFFNFLYASEGAATPDQVLHAAASYLVDGNIAKYIVASLAVSVVFFVLFSGFVSSITKSIRQPRPSFICLDQGDETRRTELVKSFNKRWTRFGATIFLDIAVALGIVLAEDRLSTIFNWWPT